jgi:succinyl-CoA:acetate CoA-transferase
MVGTTERFEGDLPVVDAATAAGEVPTDGTVAVSGFGSVGYPKAVPTAIRDDDRDYELTVISGGSLGAEVDRDLVESGDITRRFPYQAQPVSRAAVNEGRLRFHDRHIAPLSDEVEFGGYGAVDVALVEAVAVGEDWFVPSTCIGPTPAYVACADRLIVEVNGAQPLELGAFHDVYRPGTPPNRGPIPVTDPAERVGCHRIRFDPGKLVAVVRSSTPDSPYEFREPTAVDRAIGENLAAFLVEEATRNPVLAERVTLQFGVGSLGNALMSAFDDVDFGDRDVVYFGEVMQDGLLDMLDSGSLRSASAASLALSTEGQERLFGDIDRYAESVVLRPSDVSNSPELIRRFGVVAVNAALEVDVYGHANSTHIDGTHVVNGIGGSGDFVRNAHVSVIALGSTASGGAVSRIVPMVPHVDHTEHDFGIVVTEQGVADLRGLDPRERAERLVDNCAHPDVRADLRAYLDRAATGGGHIPHDLDTAFSWHGER